MSETFFGEQRVVITRTFSVSREDVWRAWTEPSQVAAWWGPFGVTNPVCDMDFREGGKLHIVMLAGEELGQLAGQRWPMTGEFREIHEPEKIVFTNQAIDEEGNVLIDGVTTVLVEEGEDGGAILIVDTTGVGKAPQAAHMLAGMEDGWNQSIDKLAEFLEGRE